MGKLKALPPRLGTLAPYRIRQPENRQQYDKQRNEQPWRKWYNTTRWRKLRWTILLRDRFTCQMCGRIEGDTSKLVADHDTPHRGSERLFWDEGNLKTLCKSPCHDKHKQRQEQGIR